MRDPGGAVPGRRLGALVRRAAQGLWSAGLLPPLARASGRLGGPSFQVLTYHRVNDERDPFFPAMSTAALDRHLGYVSRVYRVLTVEELVDTLSSSGTVPVNALAITFDDGYRDTLTHAAPVLARHGLRATVFLSTDFIGTGRIPWFDMLALALKETRCASIEAPWGGVLSIGDPASRVRLLSRLQTHFKRLPEAEFGFALERLLATLGPLESSRFKGWMLDWDDVHALAGLGFSVGAHTMTHPILSRVSEERAWAEVEGSRRAIQASCREAPRAFAYPNGGAADYTAAVVRMVERAGYACAVTTRFGLNTAATSRYELRRGGPWEEDLPTFALKLAVARTASHP